MDAQTALLFAFIGNLLAWIGCAYYAIWLKRAPLYHPAVLFLIYFLFGYVYTPLADWILGYSDIWLHVKLFPTASDIFYASFISIIGLISFVFIPPLLDKNIHDRLNVRPTRLTVTRPTVFWIAVALIGAIGIFSAITGFAFNDTATSSQYVSEQHLTGGFKLTGVSGYANLGQQFIPVLAFVLFLRYGPTPASLSLFLGFVMLRFYQGSERSGFLTLAFAILLAIMFRNGMKYLKLRHVALIVALLAVFDVLGGDRLAIQDVVTGHKTISDAVSEYRHGRGMALPLTDVHEFDCTTLVTTLVPELTGYNWFTQYARIFVWPIPRQIWPDKPVFTSRIVWMRYGNFFGLTMSMIGDAYTNCGIPSVILIMALYGFGLSWLFKRAQTTTSPILFATSAVFAIHAPLLFRDGEVGAYFWIICWIAIISAVCIAGGVRLQRRYGTQWRTILPPTKGPVLIAPHPGLQPGRSVRFLPDHTAASLAQSNNPPG